MTKAEFNKKAQKLRSKIRIISCVKEKKSLNFKITWIQIGQMGINERWFDGIKKIEALENAFNQLIENNNNN